MAVVKNYPVLTNDDNLHIGSGYLFLGTADTAYDDLDLEDAGALLATAEFTSKIETARLEIGSPKALIRVEPKLVGATLKVTFVELGITRLQKILGMGTKTHTSAATATPVVNEGVPLWGTFFLHLQNYRIKVSPTPTVKSTDATPISYTENTDYVIDYDNGLIRRLSTGAITDGQEVYVSYSYDRYPYDQLDVGPEPHINVYPLKYVVPLTARKRMILKFWKAQASTFSPMSFSSDDFSQLEVTYEAIADRTKTADKMFYSLEWEVAT